MTPADTKPGVPRLNKTAVIDWPLLEKHGKPAAAPEPLPRSLPCSPHWDVSASWADRQAAGWRFHSNQPVEEITRTTRTRSGGLTSLVVGHVGSEISATKWLVIHDLVDRYGAENVAIGNARPQGADEPTGVPNLVGLFYRNG